MIRFKDIHISKPCSVDYDSLPGNKVKRFCGSCEKYVYDFRGKDEVYLNEIFQKAGKVCGIYYEDQIQKRSFKIQRPFYYAFVAKLIGGLLFLKTLLASHEIFAAETSAHPTVQISDDSTSIQVNFKNPPYLPNNYKLNVFINNKIYRSGISPDKGLVYLPDSIQPNDEIKIIVLKTKSVVLNKNKQTTYKVRKKTYSFLFKDSSDIIVKINNRKTIKLFKRKHTAGVAVGYW
jgi:hypothetical protein